MEPESLSPKWRPTSAPGVLELRAELLREIRAYFSLHDALEVTTPALSAAGISDTAIQPMTVEAAALKGGTGYLQTSPEYAMKRLLSAGYGDIYQICRVFRDAELGRWHEPEFTLLEWYRIGWDEQRLMDEVDALLTALVAPRVPLEPTIRLRYWDAMSDALRISATSDDHELRDAVAEGGIDVPAGFGYDELLDLALGAIVAPRFSANALTFVFDYPASQAALAKIKPTKPPVAARFEVFLGSVELANGFAELTDAGEQRRRFERELEQRHATGHAAQPLDEAFLAALEAGLPDCGVAVGLDRLVALAAGLDNIAEAMAFAHGAQ